MLSNILKEKAEEHLAEIKILQRKHEDEINNLQKNIHALTLKCSGKFKNF